jgi:hypothetical protein
LNKATDTRIANMLFASVYPLYVAKVLRKGRTEDELNQILCWISGFSQKQLNKYKSSKATFTDFFDNANMPVAVNEIGGSICGIKIIEIENELTKKVRQMDKIVDELAQGKKIEKIIR